MNCRAIVHRPCRDCELEAGNAPGWSFGTEYEMRDNAREKER